MYEVYNCPGCDQAHRLDEQVCVNCNRYGEIELNEPENSEPFFKCYNCLDWNYSLQCPTCSTLVRPPFVQTIIEKEDENLAAKIKLGVKVLIVVALIWLLYS